MKTLEDLLDTVTVSGADDGYPEWGSRVFDELFFMYMSGLRYGNQTVQRTAGPKNERGEGYEEENSNTEQRGSGDQKH